jgi:glycosyltransferase involved in cell wall biosynthesis
MKALQDFRPDVIHAQDPFQFALSGLAYARKTRIPVVFTAHQVPSIARSYSPDRRITGSILERCMWAYSRQLGHRFTLITTPTQTIANLISSRTGILPVAIPFGIDTALFHPGPLNPDEDAALRTELGVPPGVQILLHAGRLDMDKRVDLVIHAAAQAMMNEPAHLLIVGDGTEKARLIQLSNRLGMSERIHFPGFVERQSLLPDIYRMASIFITASETETQGLVLLEAAACGLPIVAVNATCIPEIVRTGARIARRLDIQHAIEAYEATYRQAITLSQQPEFSPAGAWQARAKHSGVSD